MYVIRDKKSKKIRYIDRRTISPKLKATEIYPDFDVKTMEFGNTEEDYLPANFHIDKKGNITEWTLEEKIKAGLPEIGSHQKLRKGKIVDKTIEELVKDQQVTLEEIKENRIQYFSGLSFKLRYDILPDYKLENAALGVYDEQRVANYRATIMAFKAEFIRLRDLINQAKTATEIEKVQEAYPSKILEERE